MGLVGEHIEHVGESTEDYEGPEQEHNPFEGEEVGACCEVDELEGNGEVRRRNQEVAHLLALEDALRAPEAVAIAVAPGESNLYGGCTEEEGRNQKPMPQCS